MSNDRQYALSQGCTIQFTQAPSHCGNIFLRPNSCAAADDLSVTILRHGCAHLAKSVIPDLVPTVILSRSVQQQRLALQCVDRSPCQTANHFLPSRVDYIQCLTEIFSSFLELKFLIFLKKHGRSQPFHKLCQSVEKEELNVLHIICNIMFIQHLGSISVRQWEINLNLYGLHWSLEFFFMIHVFFSHVSKVNSFL